MTAVYIMSLEGNRHCFRNPAEEMPQLFLPGMHVLLCCNYLTSERMHGLAQARC